MKCRVWYIAGMLLMKIIKKHTQKRNIEKNLKIDSTSLFRVVQLNRNRRKKNQIIRMHYLRKLVYKRKENIQNNTDVLCLLATNSTNRRQYKVKGKQWYPRLFLPHKLRHNLSSTFFVDFVYLGYPDRLWECRKRSCRW